MTTNASDTLPLFQAFPQLRERIPYLPLATLPTPIQAAADFAQEGGMGVLHIKRDDQSGALYGGNKTRKLGFLLAAARADGAKSVITFGAAGSNHALATARYARELGMGAALVLGPQHNSRHVRENLLAMHAAGALLFYSEWKQADTATEQAFCQLAQRDGCMPYVIPPGGSSAVGALGFVNAAFELRTQIDAGLLPEPEVVYVASGTMGTCIGLALGLRALGMKTRVMAVRVTTAPYTSVEHGRQLFADTLDLLRQADATFPTVALDDAHFSIRDEFFGVDYALYTPGGMAAVCTAAASLGLELEGVYTGKAFAGLLADADAGALRGKNVLFWNTYGGAASCDAVAGGYACLPVALHGYFELDVQPLDADGCDGAD